MQVQQPRFMGSINEWDPKDQQAVFSIQHELRHLQKNMDEESEKFGEDPTQHDRLRSMTIHQLSKLEEHKETLKEMQRKKNPPAVEVNNFLDDVLLYRQIQAKEAKVNDVVVIPDRGDRSHTRVTEYSRYIIQVLFDAAYTHA
ncbi:hypothetical protein F5148DRAFT_1148239 [Russula earlei]|uniref:Uncharacterized protein n=1 Tax=Russula earlei TaxID=71964 RepID=A0ACC0UD76_9AGAM|nr:hypothetical protein F5148DRAFT_1148239 [Russula earlei]